MVWYCPKISGDRIHRTLLKLNPIIKHAEQCVARSSEWEGGADDFESFDQDSL